MTTDTSPLSSTLKTVVRQSWLASDPVTAVAAVPAIAVLLAVGIISGYPSSGAIAAGAAFTVGFGAFKRIHGSANLAMALAAIGMGASAFVGTLAGQFAASVLAATALWGFVAGLLSVLKSDLGWVGQQCTIVLLVAGAFPGSPVHAAERTLLVLGGGAVQFTFMVLFLTFIALLPAGLPGGLAAARAAGVVLVAEVRSWSPAVERAVKTAVVLTVAVESWRWFELPNGYWMGMTVLLLVRPNPGGTFWRATERISGTVVGAVAATAVTHALSDPAPVGVVAVITGALAGLTLAMQQGNRLGDRLLTYPGSYAVFAACLTAYIVFLLDYGGLSPRGVAEERVLLTAIGGALALAVHVPLNLEWLKPRPADTSPDPTAGQAGTPAGPPPAGS